MSFTEFDRRLWHALVTAMINQLYHQRLEWRWNMSDKCVRIAVAVLAVVGLALSVPGVDVSAQIILWSAWLSAMTAVALNVFPLSDRQQSHADLFRRWSDLRITVVSIEHRRAQSEAQTVPRDLLERLLDLEERVQILNANESAAWERLLLRCQQDVNVMLWGENIRTSEQIEAERARRIALNGSAVAPAADQSASEVHGPESDSGPAGAESASAGADAGEGRAAV